MEGPQPWAEDKWHRIAIGGMALRVVKPCARCKVPNIDQETSEGGTTVTNALKAFRYDCLRVRLPLRSRSSPSHPRPQHN